MKIIARLSAAVIAVFVSLFIASPAFANAGGADRVDMTEQFSTAGQPLQVGAILIVGFVLLALVLIFSTLISNLFEKQR